MEKCKDYHVQIQQLGETNKDLCHQIQQLDKENSTISYLKSQIQQLKSEKMDLQIHKDYKQLKIQNANYKAEIQQLQADAALAKDYRQLKNQNADYKAELQRLQGEAALTKDYRQLKDQNADYFSQIQQLRGDAKDHKAQIQQFRSRCNGSQSSDIQQWQVERTQARLQIKTLTAQISTMGLRTN